MKVYVVIEYTPDGLIGVTTIGSHAQAEQYYEACVKENQPEEGEELDSFSGECDQRSDSAFTRKCVYGDWAIELRQSTVMADRNA